MVGNKWVLWENWAKIRPVFAIMTSTYCGYHPKSAVSFNCFFLGGEPYGLGYVVNVLSRFIVEHFVGRRKRKTQYVLSASRPSRKGRNESN